MTMLCAEQPIMTQFLNLLIREPMQLKMETMSLVRTLLFNAPYRSVGAQERAAFGIADPEHLAGFKALFHAGLFDGNLREIIQKLDESAYNRAALRDLIAEYAPYYTHLAFEAIQANPEDSGLEMPF